jgi:hypothetical protein
MAWQATVTQGDLYATKMQRPREQKDAERHLMQEFRDFSFIGLWYRNCSNS